MDSEITNLKVNMAKIQNDINYIKDSVKQNDLDHKEIISKINNFIQSSENRFAAKKDHREATEQMQKIVISLDNKYANKWVEKILIWIVGIVGTITITGFIYLIAETYLYMNK